jgi:hypothetical protein
VRVGLASEEERAAIYRLRHQVYAEELGQHLPNPQTSLSDRLDSSNVYITASSAGALLGFISITPPGSPAFSIHKYFDREKLPFNFDRGSMRFVC